MKNSESDSDDNDEKMIEIVDGFKVYHSIYQKLYPYQREGVAWMWKLYNKRKGGVLGDDMGLGKTFQVIAFLSGMIDAELIKHILIIMPVGLLTNWENEFKKWCPGIKVHCFHGGTKKEKERNLLKVQRRGHVLLTSYGTVVSNVSSLTELDGTRFVWDFVILDEGHKIKNPTKTTKAVHELPARNRLVLTGTPIQNNLKELWALYDFAHQSTLLGSLKTFKMQYENIITRSREKDATVGEKRMGTEMAENLKQLIKPYFLRRTKAEVWGAPKSNPVNELNAQLENLSLDARKNDLIIWLYMSEPQIEIYQSFVQSDAVKSILVSKRSPLVELTTLKKICDHPRLLSQRACHQLGLNGELTDEDLIDDDEATNSSSIANVSDETLMLESGKLKFLIKLLEKLREDGHRILVFSLSRKILDMIHRILTNRKWKVMRIDGTISKMEERERRIQIFQRDSSYPVFLLTTQVGGVGITLTAADRVIIYDPSWNPATDAQAVDRIYRIGQKKDVVVYRLITCGSVEEKIYRRQIFKDSITRQATCNAADPYRYFSKQELRELFSLENPRYSATQVQLEKMHSAERVTSVSLDAHIAFLYSLNIFGISDHDLMFSKNLTDHDEDNDAGAISHDYIKKQVATAQNLIQAEGSIVEQGLKLSGCYSKPFSETIRSFKRPTVKDFYKAPAISEVIDIANDCEKDDIKSSRSFIGTGGDFEDIQTFSPDQKENSDKNFYKGPTLLEVPGNMNDYQKHDIRSSRSFIAMERNLDKDIQTFSPDQKQKRNWSNVNNKAPAIPEVIDIANDYEKDDIRSSRSFIGTGGRFDENIQTFSDQKNLPYQTENRDRSNANSFNKAPTIPEVIDIANDYQKDNLKSSRSFNLLDDEVYATPKALGHSLSKKDKITNYYTPSGKKHENPNTKSARKFLYSPDRSRLESYQSPYVRKNHAIDATSSPNATHNANSLQHKMEESSSSASKNSMCEPEIKNKAADSTICKELNANIFQTPTSKEKKISLKSPCNKVICSVEHDFELNSNCTSVHTDNVNIVNDQDINNGEGKYEDHIDKTSSPIQNKLITPRKIDFHSDLSQILNTNFDDLDFDDQPPPARGGSRRKSCARRTIILSDSEASQGSSSANTSSNKLVEYTDTEADSVEGDSFNRAASSEMNFSRSVIPDSVPNSPSRGNELDLEDIQTLSHSTKDPESKPSCDRDYISNKSEYRVKRITPLRVDQCSFKPDYSFSKALAASPLIEFESQNNSVVQSSVENRHSSGETIRNESLEDSPVHVFKKKTRNVISSDSEDSDSDRSELESVFDSINSYSSDSEDSCSNKADESQNMFSSDEL